MTTIPVQFLDGPDVRLDGQFPLKGQNRGDYGFVWGLNPTDHHITPETKQNTPKVNVARKKAIPEKCAECKQELADLRDSVKRLEQAVRGRQTSDKAKKIISYISMYYGVPVREIMGKGRCENVVWARHMAMYFLRQLNELTSTDIGQIMQREHSTVLYAIRHVRNMCEELSIRGKKLMQERGKIMEKLVELIEKENSQ